mgnify:CR=1 FL=1
MLALTYTLMCHVYWGEPDLASPRSVVVDDERRRVLYFGMKGDLKWLHQVFKLSDSELTR